MENSLKTVKFGNSFTQISLDVKSNVFDTRLVLQKDKTTTTFQVCWGSSYNLKRNNTGLVFYYLFVIWDYYLVCNHY